MTGNKSKNTAIVIWLIIVSCSCYVHLQNPDPVNVLSWDVYGYYLYLPAIFKYGNLHDYAFAYEHLANYPIAGNELFQIYDLPDGDKSPIYTIGMAILYLPFYFIADLIAGFCGYPADALSPPYQWAVVVASWVYCGLGLYFTRQVLRKLKIADTIIALSLVCIFLGSNYFHYAAYQNGMPHIYCFALYAMLVYYTLRWHENPNYRGTLIIGLIISLLCLARPSEIISLLIPMLYGVYNWTTLKEKVSFLIQQYGQVLVLAMVGISVVGIQVVYWKIGIGDFYFNGYQDHHFDFNKPHLREGLLGFRKGWLIYTPIMLFSLLGLPLLISKWKNAVVGLYLFLMLNVYIVLSWHIWWYAGCFGMRALIQSYAILIIPLAFFLQYIWASKVWRSIVLSILALFVMLNQFQDWQYRKGILLQDEMNSIFYMQSFFKTSQDLMLRKYVDTNEKYSGNKNVTSVAQKSYIQDSLGYQLITPKKQFGDKISIAITDQNIAQFKGRWIQAQAEIKYEGNKFDLHQIGKLVLNTNLQSGEPKWKGVRIQRVMPEGKWTLLDFDYQVPSSIAVGDNIELLIWNNGPDNILAKNISLNIYNQ